MRATKEGDQTHAHPMFCDESPRIFLTAPPSYAVVAIDFGHCEKRLRFEKLATSSKLELLSLSLTGSLL
jgi:hypothetical protein